MDKPTFRPAELVDYLFSFPKGVNAGIDPILLPKDQLASGSNTTVRGNFVTHRPPFKKVALTFEEGIQDAFEDGRFQGACVYNPDSGNDSLMVSISGRVYRIEIPDDTQAGDVSDVTIPGDPDLATQTRAWMIQAEKWIIKTDGTATFPYFYDGVTPVRSTGTGAITLQTLLKTQFTVPAQGSYVSKAGVTPGNINVDVGNPFTGEIGDIITIAPVGSFVVTGISGGGVTLNLKNYAASPVGAVVKVDNLITWTTAGNQLPGGRELVYGMGRVWMALTDGKQFLASDLVGGSSGTDANDFRDSVLNITENDFLLGGGFFTVPGAYGEIRGLCFTETLDSSLGQGALQVFTPRTVFSCNAPVDRTVWQTMQNPILTESSKAGGGLSQWSTINANSDVLSRSAEGIRSLVLARREFNTWGNTTVSREVQPQIDRDSEDLLRFTSAVNFDNRFLITSEGVLDEDRGTYFKKLIPLNFDPNSSIQGKAPSVYDSLSWSGLNIFQILRGQFGNVDRCFMFTFDVTTEKIEVWELLRSREKEYLDNDTTRIPWSFETYIDFGQKDPRLRQRVRLSPSEIWVDELHGTVDFQVYYRPDSWPCWVPWHSWQECSTNPETTDKPGFRPRMGLPEPSSEPCDEDNNRPLREGYAFHIKIVITGDCVFKGGKFMAVTVPEPSVAKPICTPICS